MNIRTINAYKVTLPFKATFSHSQKNATSVDNIVVEVVTYENGLRGYGEGAPRPYVTGETQDTAIRDVGGLCLNKCFPWNLHDVGEIWDFVTAAIGEKDHNSALCALEMALLDVLARNEDRNILDYLPKNYFTSEVRYGGVLPMTDEGTVFTICRMMREFDIKGVRLKMGRDLGQNRASLETARQVMDGGCELRVDVNGAWDLGISKQHLPLLVSYEVSVLEQPMMPEDPNWRELADILRTRGVKLMADESVCSMEDLNKAMTEGYFDLINVRLSKCGGFSNSLKMIERIRDTGLTYQVGCQLGESGILSAAGRALCAISSDALYYDGSYDAFLLEGNLTTEHVTFGHGGKAIPLKEPGLGITVDKTSLDRFSDYVTTIERP
jgi:muconate cycloisomerase